MKRHWHTRQLLRNQPGRPHQQGINQLIRNTLGMIQRDLSPLLLSISYIKHYSLGIINPLVGIISPSVVIKHYY